jgi:hypothetical protein
LPGGPAGSCYDDHSRYHPEVQAELARRAAAEGRALEAYAADLLEEAAHLPDPGRFTQDRLASTLRDMAQFSSKIPSLPDEAFTRDVFYQDHD